MRVVVLAAILGSAVAASAQTPPTFYKDVLPILQNNCQTCHRPGEVAPMSLISYEDARPWARSIKTKTQAKQMPPWFADPDYGLFSNERKLTSREIETLAAWADAGAPAGNPKDAPPAKHFEDGWNIKPDVIVEMPKAVRASGDRHHQLQVHRRPHELQRRHVGRRGRDAAGQPESAPSRQGVGASAELVVAEGREARRSVRERDAARHHRPQRRRRRQRHPRQVQPGLGAQRFDQEGAAKFVPKGSDLVYEMHYTTNGKVTSDVSKLGLVLAKDDPAKRYLFHAGPTASNLAIPAGRRQRRSRQRSDARGARPSRLRAAAHAPARQGFRAADDLTGWRKKTVLKGKFDFEWQMGYQFAEALRCRRARSSASSRTSTTRRRTASIRIRRRRSCGVPRTGTR